jgi:predicted AAA+ superfamily ATPase
VGDEERKQQLLQEYLSTYLFKDVKGLVKEENIRAFNHLLHLLAQNQGQLVEASSLARELGVSAPTVSNYLTVLDQTYVNFLLPSYHSNLATWRPRPRPAWSRPS